MALWIQPCAACADLYGQLVATDPHDELTLNGAGDVKGVRSEEHYTFVRCCGVFARSRRAAGATDLDGPERGAALIRLLPESRLTESSFMLACLEKPERDLHGQPQFLVQRS